MHVHMSFTILSLDTYNFQDILFLLFVPSWIRKFS